MNKTYVYDFRKVYEKTNNCSNEIKTEENSHVLIFNFFFSSCLKWKSFRVFVENSNPTKNWDVKLFQHSRLNIETLVTPVSLWPLWSTDLWCWQRARVQRTDGRRTPGRRDAAGTTGWGFGARCDAWLLREGVQLVVGVRHFIEIAKILYRTINIAKSSMSHWMYFRNKSERIKKKRNNFTLLIHWRDL